MKRFLKYAISLPIAFALVWFIMNNLQQRASTVKQAEHYSNIVPIAVIGSGPAGLSAALYGARAAIHTVVFEGKMPGGQLTTTSYVENWPGTPKSLGSELIAQCKKQAEKFGALIVDDTVSEVDLNSWPFVLKTEDGLTVHALSVIIATGSKPKLLSDTKETPGEKEYFGYGVTTCAVCDAPFYKGKTVAVIGGGDSAVEEAVFLTAYAKKIYMLVRGSAMRAAAVMQERLKDAPSIQILYNTQVQEIIGNGNTVTGIKITNTKDNQKSQLAIDGVFLAIGHKPNSHLFKKYIRTDNEGYIILPDRSQRTTVPGIFAAGDVSDHIYRQAGIAAGDGIRAALDAIAFLQGRGYSDAFAKTIEKNYFEPVSTKGLKPLPKIITNKDFDTIAKNHEYIVLEVGAEYCASCKALVPILQSVAARMSDKVFFAQIDLGTDPQQLIKRFDLKAIPAILVFKKDKLMARYDQQVFSRRELFMILTQLIEG